MQITSVTVRGPFDDKHLIAAQRITAFFPKDVPSGSGRPPPICPRIARQLSPARPFAGPWTIRRSIAWQNWPSRFIRSPEKLSRPASPKAWSPCWRRRVSSSARKPPSRPAARTAYPFVDEYSLASRLSYFLWSSMPDDELLRPGRQGELRQNLSAQMARMLKDPRSEAFVQEFHRAMAAQRATSRKCPSRPAPSWRARPNSIPNWTRRASVSAN